MKFGILQFFSWPERRVPLQTVYDRALERIQIMDTTGYDAVWLAEHHFSGYSVCPSVHMMGTHVAANKLPRRKVKKTTKIRVHLPVRRWLLRDLATFSLTWSPT